MTDKRKQKATESVTLIDLYWQSATDRSGRIPGAPCHRGDLPMIGPYGPSVTVSCLNCAPVPCFAAFGLLNGAGRMV